MWQLRTEWVPGAPLGWLPGSRLLGVFREGALHSAPRQALLSASSSTFWSLPCFTLCINLLCFLFSTKLYRSLCSDCALRLRCEISRMSEHSYWCFGGFQRGGIVPTFALWGRFWVLGFGIGGHLVVGEMLGDAGRRCVQITAPVRAGGGLWVFQNHCSF